LPRQAGIRRSSRGGLRARAIRSGRERQRVEAQRIPIKLAKLASTMLAAGAVAAIAAGPAGATTLFNNSPIPKLRNVHSLGFESDSLSELGGQVQLTGKASLKPTKVSVMMSSWACENLQGGAACLTAPGGSFKWPITLNIYQVGPGNQPGALIESVTQNATIPFRPSARKRCAPTSEGVVGWSAQCFSSKAFLVSFTGAELGNISLPEKVILSVAYNTTHHGYAPTNAPSIGEDSLNVGLTETSFATPSAGASPLLASEEIYMNTTWEQLYLSMPAGSAVGTFSLAAEWESSSRSSRSLASRRAAG
jgi:hypothetical protein